MPTTTNINRAVPHNIEAERAVLGSVLLDNGALNVALEFVNKDDFFSESHRLILGKILALSEKHRAIDTVTLAEELLKDGLLEQTGGTAYLASLTDGVPIGVPAAVSEYAQIVKEKAVVRRLISASNNVIARCLEGANDSESILDLAQTQLSEIKRQTLSAEVVDRSSDKIPAKPESKQKDLYPRVPAEAWHPAAELYRKAVENASEGSDNWHFICFYTMIGAALGRTVFNRMGRTIYPNLYTILVGKVGGDGKDTCIDYANTFLNNIDSHLFEMSAVSSAEGFIRHFKKWEDEEKAAGFFDSPRMLLRLGEFSEVISKAEQKGNYILALLNRAYDGPAELFVPSSQDSAKIKSPHVSVISGIALKWLRDLKERDISAGFGRRLVFVPGDPKPPMAEPEPPSETILTPLAENLRETLNYWKARQIKCVMPSPSAKKLWSKWYRVYKDRCGSDDIVGIMTIGDRTACRKIATINAALDRSSQIEDYHLERAIAFLEFLYEARWPVFSEHGISPNLELENQMVKICHKKGGMISARELLQHLHVDSETFSKRLSYLSGPDGRMEVVFLGARRKRYVKLVEGFNDNQKWGG